MCVILYNYNTAIVKPGDIVTTACNCHRQAGNGNIATAEQLRKSFKL